METLIEEQHNIINAQSAQVEELLSDPEISEEKRELLEEAAELLKQAQEALDAAKAARDEGNEEEAIAKLAQSVHFSSQAALKIAQALELD